MWGCCTWTRWFLVVSNSPTARWQVVSSCSRRSPSSAISFSTSWIIKGVSRDFIVFRSGINREPCSRIYSFGNLSILENNLFPQKRKIYNISIYVTLREESREVYDMAINRKRNLNVSCFVSLYLCRRKEGRLA